MKVIVKNIGIIEKADIQIDGITVIAGENDTGKSTVSRALYAVFSAFHDVQTRVKQERADNIEKQLDRFFDEDNTIDPFDFGFDSSEIAGIIAEDNEQLSKMNIHQLADYLRPKVEKLSDEEIDEKKFLVLCSKIREIVDIPYSTLVDTMTTKALLAEFSGQVSNIDNADDAEISLQVKETQITIHIREDGDVSVSNAFNIRTEAVYIDNPFVLDEIAGTRGLFSRFATYQSHRERLKRMLFYSGRDNSVTEIINNEKLRSILDKITPICDGDVVRLKSSGYSYRRNGSKKAVAIGNLSTGIKAFAIIKMLLLRGFLEENGTIILDEPEVHLHPEWQLQFAEIIVLLHEVFGMHILLNTHSPYFLRAIQVYAGKYSVADRCRFYLAQRNGDISQIEEVTDRVDLIYEKLARPLQTLEDLRWPDE